MLITTLNCTLESGITTQEIDINIDQIKQMRIINYKTYTRKNQFKKFIKRYSIVINDQSDVGKLITGINEFDFKTILSNFQPIKTTIPNPKSNKRIVKFVKSYTYAIKNCKEVKAIDYSYIIE